MALFVYITDQCKKDSIQHNRWEDVQKFRDRILSDQRTELFDRYPAPYLKKRFARQQRLLAAERFVGEHVIVCFYRLLIRGDKEYNDFKASPVEYGDRFFSILVSDKDLESWITTQIKEDYTPEKSLPTDAEYSYLWNVLSKENYHNNEVMVYESEDWALSVQEDKVKDRLILLTPYIMQKADCEEVYCNAIQIGDSKIEIVYRKFSHLKKLFLAGIYSTDDDNKGVKILERYKEVLESPQEEIQSEIIIRNSVRSYPAFILADEDTWINIQKDNESNLALSPEESALLDSVQSISKDSSEQFGLPLFINGRAGSGKSTILQYLFADYIYHSQKDESNGCAPPLYLTYSNDLVKRSKEVVSKLLKTGYKFSLESNIEEGKEAVISDSFKEFHEFMLSLLDVDEKNLFPDEKFVDYTVFKNDWYKKFSNDPKALKDYGPDLSWHVIRTYIKGLSQDDYLELEEYEELPKDEKSVSNETFEKVYVRVWLGWYFQNCQPDDPERKYWDSQDLVRYLLQKDRIQPLFPVLFCDEAQDFTRIELEAILRLSVFSDRRLSPQDLSRVPFAFAGDPLQTLNPTGFRWEAIKSIFIQKFIYSLDPSRQSKRTELNYRELTYNYRSTKNIVLLNNSIQALRSALFDYKGLRPQTTWQFEKSSPFPVYFTIENPDVAGKLKGQNDLMIIVPCGQGGEIDFVKKDDFLKSVVEVDDKGVPRNVLSPMRAKGLEYKRVLLYGFGEYMPNNLVDMDHNQDNSIEKKLTNEYFINQLYVAASRPQKRLFVLDTKSGVKNLWKFATDPKFQAEILSNIKNGEEVWNNSLGFLQEGTEESWTKDQESLEEIAKRQENKGKSENDPYSLRQASQTYNLINQKVKSQICMGYAQMLEGYFKSAGESFTKAESYDLAIEAFWKGPHFEEISKLASTKEIPKNIMVRLAVFLSKKGNPDSASEILSAIIEATNGSIFRANLIKDQSWKEGLNKVLESIIDITNKGFKDSIKIKEVATLLEAIAEIGAKINLQSLGDLYYLAGDTKQAMKIWGKVGIVSSQYYKEAKLKLLLEKTANGLDEKFDKGELKILGEYYFKQKEFVQSARWFAQIPDSDIIAEIVNDIISHTEKDTESILQIGKLLIQTLLEQKHWSKALEFVKSGFHKKIKNSSNKIFWQNRKLKLEFEKELVESLSVSAFLPIASTSEQKMISDFLAIKFLDNKDTHWDIHPIIVGAAMERAGRIVDCLKFYEQMRNSQSLDDVDNRIMLERWIISKLRRAENLERTGNSLQTSTHREEAMSSAKNWGIEIEKISEYPLVYRYLKKAKVENPSEPRIRMSEPKPVAVKDHSASNNGEQERAPSFVESILETAQIGDENHAAASPKFLETKTALGASSKLPDTSSISTGNFKIKIFRGRKRINIERETTGEQGSIHFAENLEFRSVEVDFHRTDNQIDIPSWQIVVSQQSSSVELRIKIEGLILLFEP